MAIGLQMKTIQGGLGNLFPPKRFKQLFSLERMRTTALERQSISDS